MQKSKSLIITFLIIMLFGTIALSGCGGSAQKTEGTEPIEQTDQETFVWKVQGYSSAGTLQDKWGQNLAKTIEKLSHGRIKIEWYPVGAVVQAFEVPNAIRDGILDAEWGITANWKNLVYAAPLFTSTPGMFSDPKDYLMWMKYGGGQELWEEMVEPFNAVPIVAGMCDMEMFMWSNKKARTFDEFKGLKLRMMPFMGEILEEKGLSVAFIPGNEVVPSLERGVIDGAEYGTRATDISFGFPDAAKYYHTPGVHQPSCAIEFVVNKDTWNKLPDDLKEIVRIACEYNTYKTSEESGKEEVLAIEKLNELGVEQVELDPAFVEEMIGWINEWFDKKCKEDPMIDKIWKSQQEWGKKWFPLKKSNTLPYPDWAFE
jgi:TRAP-type mannitol/chloroaromatic compound transport system substrate-binding protein